MEKEIVLNNSTYKYKLQRKNVKNINMHIKADGSIFVSANKYVPESVIEDFIMSKAMFIQKAMDKLQKRFLAPKIQYFSEAEIFGVILDLCKNIYPYFENFGIKFPTIKFRKMVSQWGNCRAKQGVLTFNTNLMYAPLECIEYVVAHEFVHFLWQNHSAQFYDELAKFMPEWKVRRNKLKEISLRR